MHLNTYLNFGGNCEEAFRFYEQHLGAKVLMKTTFGENPGMNAVGPEWQNKIMHARIELAGTVLMANDVPGGRFEPMRSVYLGLGVDSIEEAERIYALLSDGGQIYMPIQETFFAHRFAMLRDKFGVSWMLLHERAAEG